MALETPYSSMTEADQAWANFIDEHGGTGGDGTGGDGTGGGGGGAGGGGHHGFGDGGTTVPQSANLSGSIDMPSEVVRGQSFQAGATIRNTGDTPIAGAVALVVATPDGSKPLTALTRTSNIQLEPGGSTQMTFEAQRGALDVEPSSREFGVYAATDPREATGLVAQTTAQVLPADSEQRQGDGEPGRQPDDPQWGEPQHVQELPHGWHLYVQEHLEEDKQRFFVAGENQAGETVYLDKDGSIAQEPVFFDSTEAVAQALQAYAQKLENGEISEKQRPTGNRPPQDQVAREAAAADDGPLSGVMSGRSRYAVYALAIVALYAVWKWRQGELGQVPVLGDVQRTLQRRL